MKPIWTPSAQRVADSNISALIRRLNAEHGAGLEDFRALYAYSIAKPAEFWLSLWDHLGIVSDGRGEVAVDDISRVPGATWFPQAKLNYAENLLRRSDDAEALVYRNEEGDRKSLTWRALRGKVAQCMRAMAKLGVGPGDRVAGYLPNGPEAVIAMLATTGLGAMWAACSPEYGVDSCLQRLKPIEPKLLFAGDTYRYAGTLHELGPKTKQIAENLPTLLRTIAAGEPFESFCAGESGADIEFRRFGFAHPALILFSSGTTGTPKCIMHGAGGTLLQTLKDVALHCDVKPEDRALYVTTTGWMVWNVMVASLGLGSPLVLYDGSPLHPSPSVLFDLIDAEDVSVLRIVPKLLDHYAKAGMRPMASHKLSRLKCVMAGSEPLLPHHCEYLYAGIKADVHLMSPAGGTDVMGTLASGNPTGGVFPGEIQTRSLGMKVEVFDAQGQPVTGETGELVVTQSFPSIPVGFWGDATGERLRNSYFGAWPGVWRHGDFALITERGGVVIKGRSDATLNIDGVRVGTAEIYRAVQGVKGLRECAAVEWRNGEKGELVLFVLLDQDRTLDATLDAEIRTTIRSNATARHVPRHIRAVPDLPRSSNGKVSEVAIRDAINHRGNTNAHGLLNPEALDALLPSLASPPPL